MIEGIEILDTTEVGIDYAPNGWTCGLAFLLCIMTIVIIIAVKKGRVGEVFVCGASLIGLLIWIFVGFITIQPTAYETHYQVTLDDSVSMNEFLDKYEIVKQEGKIYTVKERK